MISKKQAYKFEEQIDRLITIHGLTIENKDKAIEIVKSMNYFTIRGYGRQYIIDNSKKEYKFKSGTTIEDIYNIYLFDCELKSELIKIIGLIEKHIRSEIANLLAVKYKTHGTNVCRYYPNTTCFWNPYIANEILSKEIVRQESIVKHELKNNNSTYENLEAMPHYLKYHTNEIPIWLLIEFISFGSVQKIFNKCLYNKDKILISSTFNLNTSRFTNYLEIIRQIRNICCHFKRLYGKTDLLIPEPIIPLNNEQLILWNKNKFHSTLEILKYLSENNKIEWNSFIDNIENILSKYQKFINYDYLKIPAEWKNNIKF